ncbi:(d)CMP kinase [Pseudoflavonifractor sp. 524-17]|uniref:(d)CMP kinase n=1 Tax=Pseudoflavonifractor sp. 524-17 TaxID=2304577 RepID=UPI00137B4A9B|nr:(d)CMP kinase [Pseudoflavonifractor sp. 524-17]
MGFKSIAIDGPSGAGKSTLARRLAAHMGYLYVDTGAIYRTLGLAALRRGISPEEKDAVVGLLKQIDIDLRYGEDGLQHMYLDGEDVTQEIRRPQVSQAASAVSAIADVRAFLMDMQRDLACRHNVIMDGRDIGTVVLPDADVKIFLTASAQARAQRRHRELLERGEQVEFDTVLADIQARDKRDTERSAAPLRQAADAVAVDTTENTLEESVQRLLDVVKTGVGL